MLIGLAFAAASALLTNLGLVVQKAALDKRATEVGVIRVFATPLWLSGFGMTQAAWICQLLALRRAPLYVVQPIVASGLLVLAAAAHAKLREPISAKEWLAICLVVTGAGTLTAVAGGSETVTPFDKAGARGALWIAAFAVIAASMAIAARRARKSGAVLLAGCAGILYAITVVLSKPIAGMIQGSIGNTASRVLSSPEIYLVAILSVTALVSNQYALARGKAVTVVPIVVAAMAVLPVTAGLALYGETIPPGVAGPAILLAAAGAIAGTVLLATSPTVAGFAGDQQSGSADSQVTSHQPSPLDGSEEPEKVPDGPGTPLEIG